jgi:hypothetical protein
MSEQPRMRTRYPAHAIACIVGLVLLAIAEVTVMAILLMPLIPLIPLFFAAVVGHGCLLAAALDYAKSAAITEPVPSTERRGVTPPAPQRRTPQPA